MCTALYNTAGFRSSECQGAVGRATARAGQPPQLPLCSHHPGLSAPLPCGFSLYGPCHSVLQCSFGGSVPASVWKFLVGRGRHNSSF